MVVHREIAKKVSKFANIKAKGNKKITSEEELKRFRSARSQIQVRQSKQREIARVKLSAKRKGIRRQRKPGVRRPGLQ